jgi:predicted lipoprotein with Yx(FWY)xxD motif
MTRIAAIVSLAVAPAALVAGCGGGGDSRARAASTASPAAATTTTAPPARPAAATAPTGSTVKVRDTRYGRILVDGNGRALYLFTKESTAKSRCYGACAEAWPVFYARGRLRAGRGAERSLIGTTRRRDGRRQVTYNGHPLYYYVTDRKPGQVTCQKVVEFGGTWLVVAPSGDAVT